MVKEEEGACYDATTQFLAEQVLDNGPDDVNEGRGVDNQHVPHSDGQPLLQSILRVATES